MKIGIDARLLHEKGIGVGRYIENLIYNLQLIDHKNEYVVFVKEKNDVKISNSRWKIREANIHWHSFSEQVKFPRIINSENLDLMHFPYFSVPIFYRRPFVITMHDLIINQLPTGRASTRAYPIYHAKRFAYNVIISQALKRAKKIIVPTKTIQDELIKLLRVPRDKTSVTYEGVFTPETSSKKDLNYNLAQKKFFLYVGNAYPHKNLDRLIEGFELYLEKEKTPDTSLVLTSKNDYFYNRLKKRVQGKRVKAYVIFYEKADDSELIQLYKSAKFLVLPSLMEGFGLPAIEAMSYGTPVLVSNIPVLKEICESAAFYLNPTDIVDISEKISFCMHLSSTQIRDVRSKGQLNAEKYSWENMAKQTLEIYENCASIRSY